MTRKKKPTASLARSSAAEYLTFVAASGTGGVEAVYADENVWLSQKMMAQLYDVEVPTINYHLKKVFEDSELEEDAVVRNFRITAADNKTYDTKHYSLSAIIAVGYKVNSERAVQFRKWATRVVEEFTIKGFAMDDERLKRGGSVLSDRYFEEQLQRVREIRLSERKFYQKITDIYTTAVDYDLTAQATKRFFATVQNKLHWAIHGQTAAEVIVDRADATKEHMGLNTWTDAPHGKIQKFDVVVAKNYLTESELAQLSRLVNAYLDVAEDMALRKIPMTMQEGVISPVLANLFLHYAFDAWMARTHPNNPWCRYADDGLVHCVSESQALALRASLQFRFAECGLEMHPEKTQIVYCKDDRRRSSYARVEFDFLGFAFRRRVVRLSKPTRFFVSFNPAVSKASLKALRHQVRQSEIRNWTNLELSDIAQRFNPRLRGWLNYFGRYRRSEVYPLLRHFNLTVISLAMAKYKRFRRRKIRASRWLKKISERDPRLFAHWAAGMPGSFV